jgi:hypothetical protein
MAANYQWLHIMFESLLLPDICALYSRHSLKYCLTTAIDSKVCEFFWAG